jgi:hypothetical protein
MTDYTPPTQDEIQRVAAYWQRVERLACQHQNGFTFDNGAPDELLCADCRQIIRLVTAEQINQIKAREPYGDVRDRLLERIKRGGICVEVDGQWTDIRWTAHSALRDNGNEVHEYACLSTDDLRLILQATDVR